MLFTDTLYGTVKNRVLVLDGFVMSVSVELGRLKIRDGIKGAIVERSFPRAGCPFNRLITTQTEGSITLGALHWLTDLGISVACLRYDGTPLFTSCPTPSERQHGAGGIATLRRQQALLTMDSEPGRSLAFALLHTKLAEQIAALELAAPSGAEAVEISATLLAQTFARGNLAQVLNREGSAAAAYWAAFAATPIKFAARDQVPAHWRALGPRRSPITQTPQRAATPGHALLSYLYGIAASEIVIACHAAAGLDPALGVLHVDRAGRASLAYDLIEPLRPAVDRWLLRFLSETTFNKRDFYEHHDGTVSCPASAPMRQIG